MKKEFRTIALTLQSTFSLIWDIVFSLLSDEPKIWQGRDRFGKLYWRVYDPSRDRSITFTSEQEVREWLDQRFYKH
jgi:hypothetical protein